MARKSHLFVFVYASFGAREGDRFIGVEGLEIKKENNQMVVLLVPLIGLEPIRYRYRGILSPLCLPIPPQRRALEFYYILPYMSSLFLNLINILRLEVVVKI